MQINPKLGIAFEAGLGVLAILLGMAFGPDPRATMPKIVEGWRTLSCIAIGLGLTIPLMGIATLLEFVPFKTIQAFHQSTTALLKKLFDNFAWSDCFLLCLSAGVGEELLFRGWLQSGLMEWGRLGTASTIQPWFAISLASIAFGAVHALSKAYFVFATVFGVILGAIYYLTNEILVVIVAHAAYDFAVMAKLRLWDRST